jgi:hypothetical protein
MIVSRRKSHVPLSPAILPHLTFSLSPPPPLSLSFPKQQVCFLLFFWLFFCFSSFGFFVWFVLGFVYWFVVLVVMPGGAV